MSLARFIRQRFWMCLGLTLVFAGGSAASVGYLAAHDARSRPAPVTIAAAAPTTKAPANAAATKKPVASRTIRKSGGGKPTTRSVTARRPARSPQRTIAAPAQTTVATLEAPAPAVKKWRGVMWWGGGALLIGLLSVAYSLHEVRPKKPSTGADELLNDAPPF